MTPPDPPAASPPDGFIADGSIGVDTRVFGVSAHERLAERFHALHLGEIIRYLEDVDPKMVLPLGFRHPHSWRGYYYELAVEPAENVAVGEMIQQLRAANGHTFEGWKGGDFTMNEHTTVYLDVEGDGRGAPLTRLLLGYMVERGKVPP